MRLSKKISLLVFSVGCAIDPIHADSSGVSYSVLLILGGMFASGAVTGSAVTYVAMRKKIDEEVKQKTAELQHEVKVLHTSIKNDLRVQQEQIDAIVRSLEPNTSAPDGSKPVNNTSKAVMNLKNLATSFKRLEQLYGDDDQGNNY